MAGLSLFLPWESVEFDIESLNLPDISVGATDGVWGIVYAIAALGALALGILAMVLAGRGAPRVVGRALTGSGAVMVAAAVVNVVGGLEALEVRYGFFIAVATSVLVFVGGVLVVLESRPASEPIRSPDDPRYPPGPPQPPG